MPIMFQFIVETTTTDSWRAFGYWGDTPTECSNYYEQKDLPPSIDKLELKRMRLRK